ncbi:hypothetical protein [Microseira wollei]|uniref:hypothetical protein n=1 Tax=Microseira wollei TaxID=467598 RepID=UPI001CFE5D66|nr:hypothetical protein [Microseira wollei]
MTDKVLYRDFYFSFGCDRKNYQAIASRQDRAIALAPVKNTNRAIAPHLTFIQKCFCRLLCP